MDSFHKAINLANSRIALPIKKICWTMQVRMDIIRLFNTKPGGDDDDFDVHVAGPGPAVHARHFAALHANRLTTLLPGSGAAILFS